MAKGPFLKVALAIIGGASLYGVLQSVLTGTVNVGSKGREHIVSFAQDPSLYLFGVLFMLALGIGCLAVIWKQWHDD